MASEDCDALEVRLLLEAIHARYGYDFRDYTSDSMLRRVQAAAAQAGVAHPGELLYRVIREPAFFHSILDSLTVRVTEMFRDPQFYLAFRASVLPLLRTYPQLKFWHAGCASGEEVYASAILLSEEGLYERTQIYATDVSPRALDQARHGVYPLAALAGFASNYQRSGGRLSLEAHCVQAYGKLAVREELRKNVHFFQHDLGVDHALGEMHVIFCRNVLIYFGERLRRRVFEMFDAGLHRGGFLCLGASEALPASQRARYEDVSAAQRIFRLRAEP